MAIFLIKIKLLQRPARTATFGRQVCDQPQRFCLSCFQSSQGTSSAAASLPPKPPPNLRASVPLCYPGRAAGRGVPSLVTMLDKRSFDSLLALLKRAAREASSQKRRHAASCNPAGWSWQRLPPADPLQADPWRLFPIHWPIPTWSTVANRSGGPQKSAS